MVIVLPNRDCLVYRWLYCGSYIDMKIKQLEKKIGTLSNPSKMPSYAWGISAKHCNVGSKLAKIPGTICNKCYALKNHYLFRNVFDAHEIRRKAIEMPEWVDYMAELLIYSHLMKIFEICELTPHINHWLATREYQIIQKVKEEDVPDNLCLRVSAIKVDSPPPKFWKWTSGVHKNKRHRGRECPAYKQDGECGSCRACWSRKIKQVSYKEH
jgi:hypothetical protein